MARSLPAVVVAVALGLAFLAPAHAVVPSLKQPTWTELSPEQKQVLAPLAGEWDKLESWRRKKWLGITQRFYGMKPEEQARIQRRMVEWVKLSPDDRKLAREKFKNLQKAPPEHQEAFKQKWNEYKQLPEEEQQRLKAEAAKSKPQPKPGKAVRPPVTASAPKVVAPLPATTAVAPSDQVAPAAAQ